MMALSTGLTGFGRPLLLVALILLVWGALEGERIWTRARRRRKLGPGALAYLLDGLMIVGMLLTLVVAATLFLEGLTLVAALVGGVVDGERVGLLIVGMALALGMALVLGRAASGRRAIRELASASTAAAPPANVVPSVAETRLAVAAEQPLAYAPQYEHFEAQPLSMMQERSQPELEQPLAYAPQYERFEAQPLSMMQERWQPGAGYAASVPASFLDLKDPPSSKPERSRFALASTLLVLALVVMVVSSAVLFRHQLINILAGMESSYGDAVAASPGVSPRQPSVSSAAADVSAAAAPVVSAPTAASLAPAVTAEDGQGTQKRVKSNSLNLRAQPGIDQQVVAVLKHGDILTVFTDARLIQGATWVRVRAGNFEGWVDQSLLE